MKKDCKRVVVMHHHQLVDMPRSLNKDILVIDENPAAYLRQLRKIKKEDIETSLQYAKYITDKTNREKVCEIFEIVKDKREIPRGIEIGLDNSAIRTIRQDVSSSYLRHNETKGKWILDDICYILKNNTQSIRYGNTIQYIWEAWLPEDRPIFILDATHTVNSLQKLFPDREIIGISKPNGILKQQVKVKHITGAVYNISSLMNTKTGILANSGLRLRESILNVVGEQCAVIAAKKYVEAANLEDVFKKVDHFGNIRGRNDFMEYSNVVIIGFWMEKLKDMIEQAMIQHGMINYSLIEEKKIAMKDLRNKPKYWLTTSNGEEYSVKKYKFSNEYLDNYFQYFIMAELTQAVGRARLFNPSKKQRTVWIITDIWPDFVIADETSKINELKIDPRLTRNRALIEEGIKFAEKPSSPTSIHKALIEHGYKISLNTVGRYYKEILQKSYGK